MSERDCKIEHDLLLLKWMVAGLYAITGSSLWLLLCLGAKIGGVG